MEAKTQKPSKPPAKIQQKHKPPKSRQSKVGFLPTLMRMLFNIFAPILDDTKFPCEAYKILFTINEMHLTIFV